MINHWPSGGRDTTQFPDFNIEIEADFRSHLEGMLKFDGVEWNDFEKQKNISGLDIEPQRFRSYRKLLPFAIASGNFA